MTGSGGSRGRGAACSQPGQALVGASVARAARSSGSFNKSQRSGCSMLVIFHI